MMNERTIPFMDRLKAIRDRVSAQNEGTDVQVRDTLSPTESEAETVDADATVAAPTGADTAPPAAVASMWEMAIDADDLIASLSGGPEAADAAEDATEAEPEAVAEEVAAADPAPDIEAVAIADEPKTAEVELAAAEQADAKALLASEPEPEAATEAVAETAADAVPQEDAVAVVVAPDPAPEEEIAPAMSQRRSGRVKTRLLGFESSDGKTVDVFEKAGEVVRPDTRFPVGWIVVVKGPGRGESFTLKAGVSPIGRDEDQAVQLDFGDTSVSRTNHASIAFDDEDKTFYIGHGGKSNLVRLNGKPLLSTETLKDGDLIRIGETTLRLVALCGQDFSWADEQEKAK